MKKYIVIFTIWFAGVLSLTGCSDFKENVIDDFGLNTLNFEIGISGATRAGMQNSDGEDEYNENKFDRVDIFLYEKGSEDNVMENVPAALHKVASLSTSSETTTATISFSELKESLGTAGKTFWVYAVANCPAISSMVNPTLGDLKAQIVENNTFRSADKQSDFVMTTFAKSILVTLSETSENVKAGDKLQFRRVAAKIRVALDVVESITDAKNETWYPDLSKMRIYISNGVKTARLDGSLYKEGNEYLLGEEDYYNIVTSGSTTTEDYNYARKLEATSAGSSADSAPGTEGENTPDIYCNRLPYYTYPNEWTDGMSDSHQTMLTIVVPWKDKKTADYTIYKPTYYRIPVNNNTKIESNAYYYIRTHIGMIGSETSEEPMEVEMQCEIADWGYADNTDVSLRPLRYLIFNQRIFNIYNERSITIPFSSTHPCKIVKFEGQFYKFTRSSDKVGDAVAEVFDETTKWNSNNNSPNILGEGKFCNYTINNTNNTITFTHNFFDIWNTVIDNNNKVTRINGPYPRQSFGDRRNKFYSQVDVTLTIRHDSGQDADSGYEETISLTFYPAIYVTTEYVDPAGSPIESGWVFINGYGHDSSTETGGFGEVRPKPTSSSDTQCLTTFTVTQFDAEEARLWRLADPRTYHINNLMTNNTMLSDTEDITDVWTDDEGPYDGTQTKRHPYATTKNEPRVIWQYYNGPDWEIPWSFAKIWNVKSDYWCKDNEDDPNNLRSLRYYYPASEMTEDANIVAPKFTVVSYHYRNGAGNEMTREKARRKCATSQQYGYPAGRWRLPTKGEVEIIRTIQNHTITLDIFGSTPFWCSQGYTNGTVTEATGQISISGTGGSHWVRCVYDTWYWEQVDADGHEGMNRIPNDGKTYTLSDGSTVIASDKELWKYFTWGDRPKENPQTQSTNKYTVESFLKKHSGVQPVE